MITYSRQEMERQLVADRALWGRMPVSLAGLLWPLEVVLLGWDTGWWAGLITVLALGAASDLIPGRLAAGLYLVDLLEGFLRLPLRLGWLLLVGHLWLREPLFSPLGQPLVGAVATTASLLVAARLLAPLARYAARRVTSD